MREYYTEAFYARVLKSNINDKANAQRIHPPQCIQNGKNIRLGNIFHTWKIFCPLNKINKTEYC